ncbi:MAG: hypothetical protein NVS9B15_02490 [Acidobacteriaceae bacterium]
MSSILWWPSLMLLMVGIPATPSMWSQASAPPAPAKPAKPSGAVKRTPLDHIVAVVNGDLILESDIETERRFDAFQPLRAEVTEARDKLIERLIDRDLILQQMQQQPQPPIPDAEVDAQLAIVRKDLPECAAYHCDTDAGWTKFAADHGSSVAEVRERWRLRMEVLRFIEQRFRMGIRITQAEIDDYYKSKLVPAYQKSHANPPAESSITDRIEEILLQQQVTGLLDDWLKALRAQGSVRTLDPEGSPR